MEEAILTLGRTMGEGGVDANPPPPPPIKFFLNFSETNYHLHLLFSVAVRIFLTNILTKRMGRYGYER